MINTGSVNVWICSDSSFGDLFRSAQSRSVVITQHTGGRPKYQRKLLRELCNTSMPGQPAMFVRDLGIYLDRDLSMRTHVQRTVSRCFAALRQLGQARFVILFQLPHSRCSWSHSSIPDSPDYGNSMLVGLPAYTEISLFSMRQRVLSSISDAPITSVMC